MGVSGPLGRVVGGVASDCVQGVGQDRQEHLQVLPDRSGAAGQVDDEAAPQDARHAAAQRGQWCLAAGLGPQGLRQAWHRTFDGSQGGLRRDVSRPQARAAGRDDEVCVGRPPS